MSTATLTADDAPAAVRGALAALDTAREADAELRRSANAMLRAAIRAEYAKLREKSDRLTVRDAAEHMGLSFSRVATVLRAAETDAPVADPPPVAEARRAVSDALRQPNTRAAGSELYATVRAAHAALGTASKAETAKILGVSRSLIYRAFALENR